MLLGYQLHASVVLPSTKEKNKKKFCVGHGGVCYTLGKINILAPTGNSKFKVIHPG
jgi:hypothetical protein